MAEAYPAVASSGVDLTPTHEEIRKELESHHVMKVADKLAIAEGFLRVIDTIVAKLNSIGRIDLAGRFSSTMPEDFKGDRKRNLYLSTLFIILRNDILRPILDNPNHVESFHKTTHIHLRSLKTAVDTAQRWLAADWSLSNGHRFHRLGILM